MKQPSASYKGRLVPQFVCTEFLSERRMIPSGDRIAILASYAADNRITLSLDELIKQLLELDYDILLVRATDDHRPLEWPRATRDVVAIGKPNIGYDFGSWAVAMDRFPQLTSRRFVLLVNDSLVGPFSSIGPLVCGFESAETDVWGLTGTTQFIPHLQSYFLGFRDGVLADPAIAKFWTRLPLEASKMAMVERYELGLTRLLFGEAFSTKAEFEPELVAQQGQNPTVHGWNRLIELGFPFVKRTIVTDPSLIFDGNQVSARVKEIYGVRIEEWL